MLDFLAGKKQEEMTDRDPFDAVNLQVGKYVLLETKTDVPMRPIANAWPRTSSTNPNVDCLVGLWEYNPPALLLAVEKSQLKTESCHRRLR